ncbi:MAG: hypothetical protein OEU54_06745 [Gemmatimonadota bacterium]|nr:hypothetical protein [Gemmatimonadota bacterium]
MANQLPLGQASQQRRKWGLVVINSGSDLLRITAFGFILAYWT